MKELFLLSQASFSQKIYSEDNKNNSFKENSFVQFKQRGY